LRNAARRASVSINRRQKNAGSPQAVLYITSTRLMRESEDAVRQHAGSGDGVPHRVCSQLVANEPRYTEWHALHELKMRNVAGERLREPQVRALRAVAVQQVHRTALINYLRLGRIKGSMRDEALRLFHGVRDLHDAMLAEHRSYLLAASTQVCAHDLLALVGDNRGVGLLRHYELAYMQYFAMFCERAFALQGGRNYLLTSLLPEIKGAADRLRLEIVGADVAPRWPRLAAFVGGSASSTRTAAPAAAPRDRRFGPRAAGLPAGTRASTHAARRSQAARSR
jgi:hypothetical protein